MDGHKIQTYAFTKTFGTTAAFISEQNSKNPHCCTTVEYINNTKLILGQFWYSCNPTALFVCNFPSHVCSQRTKHLCDFLKQIIQRCICDNGRRHSYNYNSMGNVAWKALWSVERLCFKTFFRIFQQSSNVQNLWHSCVYKPFLMLCWHTIPHTLFHWHWHCNISTLAMNTRSHAINPNASRLRHQASTAWLQWMSPVAEFSKLRWKHTSTCTKLHGFWSSTAKKKKIESIMLASSGH